MMNSCDTSTMLQQSYDIAQQIMKNRATSFYQAFRYLSDERFKGVAALYAFCRYCDDVVDGDTQYQSKNGIKKTLDLLEDRLKKMYSTGSYKSIDTVFLQQQKWWLAFEDTIGRFNIPLAPLRQQIAGQRMDVEFKNIQTIEELVEYSRLVAGSVGTMMLPILAAQECDIMHPGFVKACENLGIAMQITNILRDVGEDLRTRNRLYLPLDMLADKGIERTELEKLSHQKEEVTIEKYISEEFITLWEQLAQLADVYYQDYEQWLAWFHPSCQMPLMIAARSYQAIADAVRKEKYDCFTKRCYTSFEDRTAIIKTVELCIGESISRCK